MFYMVIGLYRSSEDSLACSEHFLEWKMSENPKPAFLEFSTVHLSESPWTKLVKYYTKFFYTALMDASGEVKNVAKAILGKVDFYIF